MSQNRILIIDDDQELQDLIRFTLERKGYDLAFANSGREGLHQAKRFHPNLILLDFALPGINGVEVHRLLRSEEATKDVPILIMTGLEDSAEAIKSAVLSLGVEDYLHKPFGENELLRHIEGLLHEKPVPPKTPIPSRATVAVEKPPILQRGRIRMDLEHRRIWVGGHQISKALGPKRFDLLRILLQHRGPVNRETLRSEGWGGGEDLKTVDRTISRLREALGAKEKDLIVSVPGGYTLAG